MTCVVRTYVLSAISSFPREVRTYVLTAIPLFPHLVWAYVLTASYPAFFADFPDTFFFGFAVSPSSSFVSVWFSSVSLSRSFFACC